jgi:hypothetical protein
MKDNLKIQKNPVIPKGYIANDKEKIQKWMNKLPIVKNYKSAIEADEKWNKLKEINNV